MSKASSKAKEEELKEEEKPKTPAARPQAERYEKQEKGEKQEKHEKEAPEKHEKRGAGIWGSVLAGILLVVFGIIVFLATWYNVSLPWWPIFLVLVGIAIIIYAIIATSAMRRNPSPPA